MAINYAYNYAQIDPETNMCISVQSYSSEVTDLAEYWVEVPANDPDYLLKYYNWDDGKFYYDPEYTQEYISPLL